VPSGLGDRSMFGPGAFRALERGGRSLKSMSAPQLRIEVLSKILVNFVSCLEHLEVRPSMERPVNPSVASSHLRPPMARHFTQGLNIEGRTWTSGMPWEFRKNFEEGCLRQFGQTIELPFCRLNESKLFLPSCQQLCWHQLSPTACARAVGSFDLAKASTAFRTVSAIKFADCFGRKPIFKRGEQEVIPILCLRLQPGQELDCRAMGRDARHGIGTSHDLFVTAPISIFSRLAHGWNGWGSPWSPPESSP